MRLGLGVLGVVLAARAGLAQADASAGPSSADSTGVHAALNAFLRSFENLDWEHFRASFTEHATVFFPSAATPDRFEGRAAIEARFQQEFAGIRAQASGGPPYMRLEPIGLQLEMLDDRTALVTFELHSAVRVARRSILFVRTPAGWRIRHLHASNVPWPDQPAR
jgi:SnoaL-like protein